MSNMIVCHKMKVKKENKGRNAHKWRSGLRGWR